MFGVQIAGGFPNRMVPAAEIIANTIGKGGGVDFVDVNMGCPIDLVFNQGAGSARKSFLFGPHKVRPLRKLMVLVISYGLTWTIG